MPADRLTHPRIGRSRKVRALNDLEFRVWDTYRWAADDFGVLPKSSTTLRGANDALRDQHTEPEIAVALQRLVEIELLVEFDHQGAPFVCSLEWNKHQKIMYPRQTFLPVPPPQVFERMDVSTRKLFRNFHEYFQKSQNSRARARAKRLTAKAKGKRLKATAPRERSGEGPQRARFERFWAVYPRKLGKDAAWREWLHRVPDDALTDTMIARVQEQRHSTGWRKDNGAFIPKPFTWLHEGRWQDETEITPPPDERQPYVAPEWIADYCHHSPCCETTEICRAKRAAALQDVGDDRSSTAHG